METAIDQAQIAREWLEGFSDLIRRRDYEAAKELFANDVASFGTVTRLMRGLDTLCEEQWRRVWEKTRGFRFDLDQMVADGSAEVVWVAATWTGEGIGKDGRTFPRSGRATFVLQHIEGRWMAVHSHLSRDPDGEL